MKKALELNYLTRNKLGFTLAIDPSTNIDDSGRYVQLSLCFSKSTTTNVGLDKFRSTIKDFVEIAFNVQKQLEMVNDSSRLRTFSLVETERGHNANVSPPMMTGPPVRKPSLTGTVKRQSTVNTTISTRNPPLQKSNSCVHPPAVIPHNSSNEIVSRSNSMVKPQIKRKSSLTRANLLASFDCPAEAKLFETYMRKKAQFVKNSQKEIKLANTIQSQRESAGIDTLQSSQLKRMVSLPVTATATTTTRHRIYSEDRTPVMSNKKAMV
jgi:hypothetical protein